ncbi:MAG: efflux RND transporter periplasmic adaptor subunit [Armatimonadota bacterium]|nr:efflux RND transporter periplasmic adaptor subunit [Armatimonadota bacterium]MDR7438720.1 efflux RND transporter periplasmic adaptor subunit [Armatimonadota bacterium]MDR7561936.1 efflux RND transporter periplasmic adaptor subunit [Armatimonadota bacterium]MDR7567509.1 efflux RND transporter periplasmic adaptor subunit [Armatimonadota bacterium]MDR7601847.1 efflux RND transporter periplasmic adaptor subunit [Armatimonadota bacterium]
MRRVVLFLLLTGLVGLGAWRVLSALQSRQGAQIPASGPPAAGPRVAVVRTEPARLGSLAVRATYVGEVQATGTAEVLPRISGVVQEVRVREGDLVRPAQVLVVLDPRELHYQVEQARAVARTQEVAVEQARAVVRTQEVAVEQARANLQTQQARLAQLLAGAPPEQIRQAEEQVEQARAAVDYSRGQLRRTEELYRQGFVAQSAVDAARTDLAVQEARLRAAEEQLKLLRRGPSAEEVEVARSQMRQAEAALHQAEAQMQQARLTLRHAQSVLAQARTSLRQAESLLAERIVRAPVSGVVASVAVDPGDSITPATRLVQLVRISPVEVALSVPERDLGRIRPGMEATVRADAFPGRVFSGRVSRMGPVLSSETRTATVRVEVPNSDFALRPGMTARVELVLSRRERVVTVPLHAVVEGNGARVVFVVEGGVARARTVELGISDGEQVEVVRGVRVREPVVVAGQEVLRDGMPVRLVDPPARERRRP